MASGAEAAAAAEALRAVPVAAGLSLRRGHLPHPCAAVKLSTASETSARGLHLHVNLRVQPVPISGGGKVLVDAVMQSYMHAYMCTCTFSITLIWERCVGDPSVSFAPFSSAPMDWGRCALGSGVMPDTLQIFLACEG